MEEEIKETAEPSVSEKAYELLSLVRKGQDVTLRDDQYKFPQLLDAVIEARQRGSRFRLIDSGKLGIAELEWLAQAGADFYTSDKIGRELPQLETLNSASQKGRSLIAFLVYGSLNSEEEAGEQKLFSIVNLGRSGIYLHISNREKSRDFSSLDQLAYSCLKGGSRLVYYHHGALAPEIVKLAGSGVWVHVSDKSLEQEEQGTLILEAIHEARASGANLVFYIEKGLEYPALDDILKAGAFVLFKHGHSDYASPFKALEGEARKKLPDFRAFYLYPALL